VPEATEQIAESIGSALDGAPHWLVALALMALLPAVCEELAFRGFVLSGFRHVGHKWWAIALSAVAFGLVHTFLHQKISATMMGMVIGYVAVQTESIWPCILLHTVHNSLQLSAHKLAQAVETNPESPLAFLWGGESPLVYRTPTVLICAAVAAAILWSLHGVRYSRTAEEQLEEARQRESRRLGILA
jgi:sodium transport system permease protein